MKLALLCALFLVSSFAFAVERIYVAKVTLVRGDVTKLLPGDKQASKVEKGDALAEDTSVVTNEKSLVTIVYNDNTSINLGPKGKIVVVSKKPEQPGVMNLLKGQVKAAVTPSKNPADKDKDRFYIKTRTAALGVRGTEFNVGYNPDNQITSLVTVKGSVAMAKVDDSIVKKVVEERTKEGVALNAASDEVSKTNPLVDHELHDVLRSDKAVNVEPGRYSGVLPNKPMATVPVRINPQQVATLVNTSDPQKKIKDVSLKDYAGEAPPEGINDTKTGKFAPRSGGFVDFETGLYVPPPTNSDFDAKKKVYIPPKSFGDVDQRTGNYVPPKGIKLDAVKGFVVDKEKRDEEGANPENELLASLSILNQDIQKDIITPILSAPSNQILPEQLLNEPDHWNSHLYAGVGYTRMQVDESDGEYKKASEIPSWFGHTEGAVDYTANPLGKWKFRPAFSFDYLYHARRNSFEAYRYDRLLLSGTADVVHTHAVNFYPAEFIIGLGYDADKRNLEIPHELHRYSNERTIRLSEQFRYSARQSGFFGLYLTQFDAYENGNKGNMMSILGKHGIDITKRHALTFYASGLFKEADWERYNRHIARGGIEWSFRELIRRSTLRTRIDGALVDRINSPYGMDDHRVRAELEFEKRLGRDLGWKTTVSVFDQNSRDRAHDFHGNQFETGLIGNF